MLGRWIVCLLSLPLLLTAANEAGAGTPLGGVLVDENTFSIRPIVSDAGQAYAGEPSVRSARYAVAAPDGRTALVVTELGVSVVRRVQTSTPVWRLLTDEPVDVDRAVWSSDANAVAIYDSRRAVLKVWRNVQSDPAPAGVIDLTPLPTAPALLALAGDASCVFATVPERDFSNLYVLPVDGLARPLLSLARPAALLLDGGTLYVADRGLASVEAISGWQFGLSVRTVVAGGNGLTDPTGIALSADRRQLYVADAGSRQVLAFDVSSSEQKGVVELNFSPTGMEPVDSGSLFLLEKGAPGSAPAQVLQVSSLQVLNVPFGLEPRPAAQ